MNYQKNFEKNMQSLSILSNIHSSIRNCLLTLSIAYIIISLTSNNTLRHPNILFGLKSISFSFVIIGIIICFFSIQNIFSYKEEYPETFKWIIPHIIILIICFIIIFNRIIINI